MTVSTTYARNYVSRYCCLSYLCQITTVLNINTDKKKKKNAIQIPWPNQMIALPSVFYSGQNSFYDLNTIKTTPTRLVLKYQSEVPNPNMYKYDMYDNWQTNLMKEYQNNLPARARNH